LIARIRKCDLRLGLQYQGGKQTILGSYVERLDCRISRYVVEDLDVVPMSGGGGGRCGNSGEGTDGYPERGQKPGLEELASVVGSVLNGEDTDD
jgi:hypothetical protein